jgi:ABC-type multidrug transport system ATPase subunit
MQFGLVECADTLIGIQNRIKCISGGEMKRLSLATELLAPVSLIFCDEPTSGLDSYMAENIVQILKQQAKMNRTIVCTVHQPSSQTFALFDHLILLAEGRVAFMGESTAAADFFSSLDLRCPVNFNPADYYIRQLAIQPGVEDACRRRVKVTANSSLKCNLQCSITNFETCSRSFRTLTRHRRLPKSTYISTIWIK